MYRVLSDLRILRLAEHLEATVEAYEERLRDAIDVVPIRASLAPLFAGGAGHKRLAEAIKEWAAEASTLEPTMEIQDVLQTILECEKFAHDFYLNQLDRLSDPHLVKVFKMLAADEAKHVRVAEAAIAKLAKSGDAKNPG